MSTDLPSEGTGGSSGDMLALLPTFPDKATYDDGDLLALASAVLDKLAPWRFAEPRSLVIPPTGTEKWDKMRAPETYLLRENSSGSTSMLSILETSLNRVTRVMDEGPMCDLAKLVAQKLAAMRASLEGTRVADSLPMFEPNNDGPLSYLSNLCTAIADVNSQASVALSEMAEMTQTARARLETVEESYGTLEALFEEAQKSEKLSELEPNPASDSIWDGVKKGWQTKWWSHQQRQAVEEALLRSAKQWSLDEERDKMTEALLKELRDVSAECEAAVPKLRQMGLPFILDKVLPGEDAVQATIDGLLQERERRVEAIRKEVTFLNQTVKKIEEIEAAARLQHEGGHTQIVTFIEELQPRIAGLREELRRCRQQWYMAKLHGLNHSNLRAAEIRAELEALKAQVKAKEQELLKCEEDWAQMQAEKQAKTGRDIDAAFG
eukprot:RCo013325